MYICDTMWSLNMSFMHKYTVYSLLTETFAAPVLKWWSTAITEQNRRELRSGWFQMEDITLCIVKEEVSLLENSLKLSTYICAILYIQWLSYVKLNLMCFLSTSTATQIRSVESHLLQLLQIHQTNWLLVSENTLNPYCKGGQKHAISLNQQAIIHYNYNITDVA